MAQQHIDTRAWMLLALLSLIWGGSFFFVGVAVQELPALLIVLARVGVAALILIPIHLATQGPLPRDAKTWIACAGMSILNNVLPFTAIAWGQHSMESGLAAIINATSPMFAALFMALFGLEGLTWRKGVALVLGLIGVVVLKGGFSTDFSAQTQAILAVTFASACYGLSAVWAKRRVIGIAPMTTATCQLISSSCIMAVLASIFSTPALYGQTHWQTWAALLGLAALSTSLAYLIFFRLTNTAGPSFTILVTMIIPVSAVLLGVAFLHEKVSANEVLGAVLIILALVIIDGRALRKLGLIAA